MGIQIKNILFRNRFWLSIIRKEIPISQWLEGKVLGMGLINFYLFIILTLTGLLLMFYYIPHTESAYQNIKDLVYVVSFGRIFRNMHRWSAYLMIIGAFLHMCRVFYTAEYLPPREFNWVTGMGLFLCTLLLGLTGYILPWDQKAYWGMTIMSNVTASIPFVGEKIQFLVLGGTEVGQAALLRAYVMHVRVLPLMLSILIAVHFWRIRKDDILVTDHRDNSQTIPKTHTAAVDSSILSQTPILWQNVIIRELSKFLLTLSIVMALAILLDAPLEEKANPAVTPNPAKAPWFFLGLQELLSWGPPFLFAIVIPNIAVLGLMIIPYIDNNRVYSGQWFHPDRRLQNILFTAFVVVVIGLILVGRFLRGPGWDFYWPWESWPIH